MNFEIGKQYIVRVFENGIIPIEEFSEERYFDVEHDSIDFLTDEEKIVIINDLLDKIRAEISTEIEKDYGCYDIITAQGIRTGYLSAIAIIDKYKVESEEGAEE